ncbi:MAG: sulfotransferase domain-containing protein [Acidimicrobiales bacterium]
MKRRAPIDIDLRAYATERRWASLIAEHGADEMVVLHAYDELLYALPGRRRVRALELASLIEARLDLPLEGGRAVNEALVASLRDNYRYAFLVDHASRPGNSTRPVVLTATPRSGNTLLQRLFAELTGYTVMAAPTVADLAEEAVTGSVFLQTHAPNDRHARRFVAAVNAEVVTIARHPLDVLLSVLHFSRFEVQILDWLDGAALPSPDSLRDATPTSAQFLDWATSKGATRLLAITHRWWQDGTAHRIRYEELIADTPGVFGKLLAELGITPLNDSPDPDQIREGALAGLANHHRWRATTNGWRDLLPVEAATKIHRAHRRVFDDLGYTLDAADPLLDDATASANWLALRR